MKQILVCLSFTLLAGCTMLKPACEDLKAIAEQVNECKALQKQIVQTKNKPILRTELERRYQLNCVDVRYYRDEHESGICAEKDK